METDATPVEVVQYYRSHFAAADVSVRVDTTSSQGGLLSVGRDGEVGAMLTISRNRTTRITVTRASDGR